MAPSETPLPFSIGVARITPTAHVASVGGEVDLHNEAELRATLEPLVETDEATVIVDLCDVSFVDSTALGVFVALAKRLRAREGRLVLVSADPRFSKLLRVTGLLSLLHLETSLAKAVEGIGIPAPA
jgi:anti-sigma B factor antagonist